MGCSRCNLHAGPEQQLSWLMSSAGCAKPSSEEKSVSSQFRKHRKQKSVLKFLTHGMEFPLSSVMSDDI